MLKFLLILFIVPISKLYAFTPDIIVSQDGSGDFKTIQEALNSIPEESKKFRIIFIKNGIYKEKIFIEKSNIVLIGEDKEKTKIIFPELRSEWRKKNNDSDYGSAVINIKNNITDLIFISLTIHNNYGSLYKNHDHQFAIRAGEGVTRIIFENCKLIADGGDTVSLWNTNDGMYYHNNCYFEGYVDYVCPRGYCFIENSEFFGHNLTASIWHDGSANENHKFIIKNSRFDGIKGFPLGRFHRDAQFFLIDCSFSDNMADKKIFFAPSDPPRILKWGEERQYFYNCHGYSKDYEWHKDNLEDYQPGLNASDITPEWTFENLWNPKEILNSLKTIN